MSESIVVTEMKKTVELPLVEPIYSTYQYQGPGSAVLANNTSVRNWYLNQVLILSCNRKFLNGFTTPEIRVEDSSWDNNPYLEKICYPMRYLKGHTHTVIKNMLDAGYYVCFDGIDDYCVEGKSWYHERHFKHDGCICGYDNENRTYCIYAYDKNWIYQKFWTTQKSFENGRKAMFRQNTFGNICGIKDKGDTVSFNIEIALNKICEYLDSDIEKYPENSDEAVYGIVVHDYIAKYVGKLYDGSIPYEKMDHRVFRLIWEHKKVMLERIQCIENELSLNSDISKKYEAVVSEANTARMLYASHHMKRRDSVLPIIQKKLLALKEFEKELLTELLSVSKGEKLI